MQKTDIAEIAQYIHVLTIILSTGYEFLILKGAQYGSCIAPTQDGSYIAPKVDNYCSTIFDMPEKRRKCSELCKYSYRCPGLRKELFLSVTTVRVSVIKCVRCVVGHKRVFRGIPGPQGRCPSNATTRPYLFGKRDLLALDSIPPGLPPRLRLRNHSESFTCPLAGQAGHTP